MRFISISMSSGTNNDDILMIKKHSVTIKHFNDNLFHWISIAVQVMSIKIFNRYSKKKTRKKQKNWEVNISFYDSTTYKKNYDYR